MNFITIDFETANDNYNSASQVGIALIKDGIIVDEFKSLIKPPGKFAAKNIEITGITPGDVANAPKFIEIWDDIYKLINSPNFVVAHNAFFDMSVLRASLAEYNIIPPNFNYLCSINICSTLVDLSNENKSLANLTKIYGYSFKHHDALEDAKACAYIVNRVLEESNTSSLEEACVKHNELIINPFLNLPIPSKPAVFNRSNNFKQWNDVKISEIKTTKKSFDTSNIFYNKNIVLTGELENYSRKEALQEIADRGGILKSGVSRNTDFLIVGVQDKKLVGETGTSSKERKAEELISKGYEIKVLSGDEFEAHLH